MEDFSVGPNVFVNVMNFAITAGLIVATFAVTLWIGRKIG
jgi:hypothetical protein